MFCIWNDFPIKVMKPLLLTVLNSISERQVKHGMMNLSEFSQSSLLLFVSFLFNTL